MAITANQGHVAVNTARGLVFFPDGECYNYKTNQWTDCDAYADQSMFSVNDVFASIGIVRENANAFDFQVQSTSGVVQDAVIETGAVESAPGQRVRVSGVRPLANGGTYSVRVGTQDNIGDSVSWSASTSVTARTGKADFRETGRYARVELTVTGGFTTLLGVDVEAVPTGRV